MAFPQAYADYQQLFQQDSVLLLKAKVDFKDEELKLIVEKASAPNELLLNHSASASHHEIFIPRKTEKSVLAELGKLLKAHPGDESVVVLIPNGGSSQRMMLPYGVGWSDKLKAEIDQLLT